MASFLPHIVGDLFDKSKTRHIEIFCLVRNVFPLFFCSLWSFLIFQWHGYCWHSRIFVFDRSLFGFEWVGLKNFIKFFTYYRSTELIRNTFVIGLIKLLFVFPFLFAIMLNELQKLSIRKTFQTISYLPHFVSWVCGGHDYPEAALTRHRNRKLYQAAFGWQRRYVLFNGSKVFFIRSSQQAISGSRKGGR